MLITIINLLLSPFCIMLFIVFLFGKESRFLVPAGTNVYRLKPVPYIIFSVVYTIVILGITQLLISYFNPDINLWEVFVPKYYWVSILTWGVSIVTISTYFRVMENRLADLKLKLPQKRLLKVVLSPSTLTEPFLTSPSSDIALTPIAPITSREESNFLPPVLAIISTR